MSSTLVIGDLHIGKKHKVTYGDPKLWDEASLIILNQLLIEHTPEKLVLLGDVFDTDKPSALEFAEFVTTVVKVPEVYILSGNHDIAMVKKPIAFAELGELFNVTKPNEIDIVNDDIFIGWHDTQEKFDASVKLALDSDPKYLYVHASRNNWGNENDNVITDEHLAMAKDKGTIIVSGHEHTSMVSSNFIFLGSVVPHTISELGPRYVMVDRELREISYPYIEILREEPEVIDPSKVYAIRPKKEITVEDIVMEEKDLTIDILEDFWQEAEKRGFTKELLND